MRPFSLRGCLTVVVVIVSVAAACGGREPAPPEGALSLIGRWEGRWEGTTGVPGCTSDRLVMEFVRQDGPRFEARVEGGCGGSFSATGELSGSAISLQGEAAGGSIRYRGSLQGGGKRMSGEWEVAVRPDLKGTWRVEKVSEQVSAAPSPTPTRGGTPSPGPTATPATGATPRTDEAFAGVPLPSGAVLEDSLRISGPLPAPVPLPPGAFVQWELKRYRVGTSAREVARFYRERMPAERWASPFSVETESPSYQAFLLFQRSTEGRDEAVLVTVEEADGGARLAIFFSRP